MPRHSCILLSMLLILAACGGGGGDSGSGSTSLDSSSTQPAPQPAAQPQSETYAVTLSGAEQVPPRITGAQGSGSASVNPATRQMTVSVTVTGTTANAVNLHQGAPGATGPIFLSLVETAPGSGTWTGRTTLSVAEHSAMRAGQFYVNVTSAAFTAGEIRGQIALRSGAGGATGTGGGVTGTAALR